MSGKSLFEKVWEDHIVVPESEDTPAVFYVDLHIIHEVTTPQAFNMLRDTGMQVRRPDLVLATMDHSTPTVPITNLEESLDAVSDKEPADQIRAMVKNCEEFGIELHGFGSQHRGIVHVIGPEIGATQPGTYHATVRIVTQAGNVGTKSTGADGEPLQELYYIDIPIEAKVK